jgi:hypothetical protein
MQPVNRLTKSVALAGLQPVNRLTESTVLAGMQPVKQLTVSRIVWYTAGQPRVRVANVGACIQPGNRVTRSPLSTAGNRVWPKYKLYNQLRCVYICFGQLHPQTSVLAQQEFSLIILLGICSAPINGQSTGV